MGPERKGKKMKVSEKTDTYELVRQARQATWSLGGLYVLLRAKGLTGSGPVSQALHVFGEDSIISPREPLPNSRDARNAYRIMVKELQPIPGIEEHPDIEALLKTARDAIRFLESKAMLLPEPPLSFEELFEQEQREARMGRIVFSAEVDGKMRTAKAKITDEEYWFLRGLLDLAGTEQAQAFRSLPKVGAAVVRLVKRLGGQGNTLTSVWLLEDGGLSVQVSGRQEDDAQYHIENVSLWPGEEWNGLE